MTSNLLPAMSLPAHALSQRRASPVSLRSEWINGSLQPQALREAQRLRHQVFAQELGARLTPPPGTPCGHDADLFDAHCEHLLLREVGPDGEVGAVVACYRLLTAEAAQRIGGFYCEQLFDLTRLRGQRQRMGELGRACVAPAYRRGAAVLLMWGAIAERCRQLGLDLLLGSASVPARDGGSTAWALWNQLAPRHLAPIEWQTRSRQPLAPAGLRSEAPELPPLLRAYLNANARLLGAPAWDPDFRCADFPLLLALQDLPDSYRRRFGA